MKLKPIIFTIVILIVLLAMSILGNWHIRPIDWKWLLTSNIPTSLVTLAVGATAFIIYFIQKKDKKRDAANIILMEIMNAERTVAQIKSQISDNDITNIDRNKRLMSNSSWNSYKYLFVNDFDRNEWDTISDFFSLCERFDENLIQSLDMFNKHLEERVKTSQTVLANLAREIADKQEDGELTDEDSNRIFNLKKDVFINIYSKAENIYTYIPLKHWDSMEKCLKNISNLSNTTIGEKFKKIVGA